MFFHPFSLWLMGPTSAGKTTIAYALVAYLKTIRYPVLHLDGDEVRNLFGNDLGFSNEERLRVVKACLYMLKKARSSNISAVVSALTATEEARQLLNEQEPKIIVGHIDCPIEICAQRDPKGLYNKAKNQEIDTLIGYNSAYKAPKNPDFIIDTMHTSVDEAVKIIMQYLSSVTTWRENS